MQSCKFTGARVRALASDHLPVEQRLLWCKACMQHLPWHRFVTALESTTRIARGFRSRVAQHTIQSLQGWKHRQFIFCTPGSNTQDCPYKATHPCHTGGLWFWAQEQCTGSRTIASGAFIRFHCRAGVRKILIHTQPVHTCEPKQSRSGSTHAPGAG